MRTYKISYLSLIRKQKGLTFFFVHLMAFLLIVMPISPVISAQNNNGSSNMHSNTLHNHKLLQSDEKAVSSSTSNISNSQPITTNVVDIEVPENIDFSNNTNRSAYVGVAEGILFDDPEDNLLTFNLDELPKENEDLFLEYEVFGVADIASVGRSINDGLGRGGNMIIKNKEWSKLVEKITSEDLQKGLNRVWFSANISGGYLYKVKNLRVFKSLKSHNQQISFIQQNVKSYGGHIYLAGYNSQPELQITILDKSYTIDKGNFELIVDQKTPEASLIIKNSDGDILSEIMVEQVIDNPDVFLAIEPKGKMSSYTIDPLAENSFIYATTSITIPVNSVDKSLTLTINGLRNNDMPGLPAEMVNVTSGYAGYRMLPHGNHFAKNPLIVEMQYDESKIPTGYTAKDIQTFYYDLEKEQWMVLQKDSVLTDKKAIRSRTQHFTDFINGIIKVPESPETGNYTPTTLSDIKAADPTAQIVSIAPPQPNNTGSLTTSFPLKLPAGRAGMQPNLAVNYNSDGGNGWLGLGWDIPMSGIGLDTRWGAPRYDPEIETELYSLDGKMLTLETQIEKDGQLVTITTNPHRNENIERGNPNRKFYSRIENEYNDITRFGSSPKNYWWVVIDKMGNKSFYGGVESVNNDAVIRTVTNDGTPGNIAFWALCRTEDVNGNYVEYTYENNYGVDLQGKPGHGGNEFYLKKINYTKSTKPNAPTSYYKVDFERNKYTIPTTQILPTRKDIQVSAREGVLRVTKDQLTEIRISLVVDDVPSLIRSYRFDYQQSNLKFFKQLLTKISEYDASGNLFYSNKMEYETKGENGEEIGNNSFFAKNRIEAENDPDGIEGNLTIQDLGGVVGVPLAEQLANKGSLLGTSSSRSLNYGGYIGVGPGIREPSKRNTAGITGGGSNSSSNGIISLFDINGDGKPDKVFTKNSKLVYRKNLGILNKKLTFDQPITISGVDKFSKTISYSYSIGAESNFGSHIGYSFTNSKSTIKTFISDINGDGLIDIVNQEKAKFNLGEKPGGIQFASDNATSPNPILGGVVSSEILSDISLETIEQLDDENPPYDIVKRWIAPKNGQVNISGIVTLNPIIEPVTGVPTPENDDYFNDYDGVTVSIQHNGTKIIDETIEPTFITNNGQVIINSTAKELTKSYLRVNKGDRLYFRVQTRTEGSFDRVSWDPEIIYTDEDIQKTDANGYWYSSASASQGFLLSDTVVLAINNDCYYSHIFNPDNVSFSDDLDLCIKEVRFDEVNGELRTENSYWAKYDHKTNNLSEFLDMSGNSLPSVFSINTYTNTYPSFIFTVFSSSNVEWNKINWVPIFTPTDPALASQQQKGVPYYHAYNLRTCPSEISRIENIETSLPVTITPAINTIAFQDLNEGIYPFDLVVKNNNKKVIGKKTIIITVNTNGSVQITGNESFVISSNITDVIFVEFYSKQLKAAVIAGDNFALQAKVFQYNASGGTPPIYNTPVPDYTSACQNNFPVLINIDGDHIYFSEECQPYYENLSDDPSVFEFVPNNTYELVVKYASIPPYRVANTAVWIDFDNDAIVDWNEYFAGTIPDQASTIQITIPDNLPTGKRRMRIRSGDNAYDYNNFNTDVDKKGNVRDFTVEISGLKGISKDIYCTNGSNQFGPNWLNWGQFAYHGGMVIKRGVELPDIGGSGIDKDEERRQPDIQNGQPVVTARYGFDVNGEIVAIEELVLQQQTNSELSNCAQINDDEARIKCMQEQNSTLSATTTRFIQLSVNPEKNNWAGNSEEINIDGTSFSTSRLGVKNLKEIFVDLNNDVEVESCGTKSLIVKALVNKAQTHSATGGYNGAGANGSIATNWSELNYLDMNGDSYPDVLTKNKIQFTNMLGKLSNTNNYDFSEVTHGTSISGGIPVDGSFLKTVAKGLYAKKPFTNPVVQAGCNALSGGVGYGNDKTDSFWQDINGDGLQDRVTIDKKSIWVSLNLGYAFNEPILWDNYSPENIHYGANQFNFNGGVGFSNKKGSFAGGLSGSVSRGHTNDDFQDINGDGLPDLLMMDNNNIYYRLNTGNGFDTQEYFIEGEIAVNRTTADGITISGSFGFPICTPPICLVPLRMVIGGNGGYENSLTRTENSISDINGDGYPDLLSTDRLSEDGEAQIRLSNIGAVNLLKKVNTPLGGSWEVRYERAGNTYNMPQSKYVVDTIIIYDAFTADEKPSGSGNDYTYSWNVTTVKYEFPNQDRREKDFLGFGMVTVRQHPAFNLANAHTQEDIDNAVNLACQTTYRYTEQEFHNTNYYLKGMLKRESLFSGSGVEWTRNVSLYGIFERSQYCSSSQTTPATGTFEIDSYNLNNLNYNKVKYKDAVILPEDPLTCTDLDHSSLFVAPIASISYISEGDINNAVTTVQRFEEYDDYGNIKKFRDYGSKPADVYTAEISYRSSVGSIPNAKGYPEFIRIKDATGNLMRERKAVYDGKGDLRQVFTTLNSSQHSQIDLDYDDFGNIIKMTNQKSMNYTEASGWSKYFIAYTYDDVLQTYPVKVEDAFGYESTTDYNYLFGIPVYSVDINGQPMRTRIDDRGRIFEVTGPDELFNEGLNGNTGSAWTIRFENENETPVNEMLVNQGFDYYDENHTKVYNATGSFDARNPGLPLLSNANHIALTRHFDPEYKTSPEDINSSNQILTVTMVDGLGKVTQVKKASSVFKEAAQGNIPDDLNNDYVWASPGKVKQDSYGRTLEEYYPTVQNIGNFTFNDPSDLPTGWNVYDNSIDPAFPTITSGYDILDRPHSKTMPGEVKQTKMDYSIFNKMFKTKISIETEQDDQVSYMLTDIRKKTITSVQVTQADGEIATNFEYDPVGQLIRVKDAEQFVTESEYDMGGRRIAYKHPDKGVTKYTYDEAGNLTKVESSNLLLKNKSVNYKYAYNRLKAIEYPEFPENNVKYFYGEAGNSEAANYNAVGRLWYQVDATGTQYFKYGKLGELILNRRSVAVPGDRVYWFQTEWTYDTWNRVKTIKYPDDELLTYHYNTGGDLHSITSEKPGLTASPKDIISQLGYDNFGQRVYLRYGNGTETTYEYEATRRRLHNLKVRNIGDVAWGSGQGTAERTFIDNIYSYDVLGNITDLANNTVNLPGIDEIGGLSSQHYVYDDMNRLITAQGEFAGNTELPDQGTYGLQRYTLNMSYDKMYRINSKNQLHEKNYSNDGQIPTGNWNGMEKSSYQLNYSNYGTSSRTIDGYSYTQPHALSQLNEAPVCGTPPPGIDTRNKQHNYLYDANGNMTAEVITATASDTIRQNLWDENDRLRAVDLNPTGSATHPVAIYTYDAAGERVLKQNSTCIAVYENAIRTGFESRNDFMLYPSGMLVVRPANDGTGEIRYTKHYYAGAERVSSKIGTTTNLGSFLRDWTLMENSTEFPENPVVNGKEQLRKAEQAVGHVYIAFGINATVTPGSDAFNPVFAFTHQATEPDHYYYHPDHLGSSSYITNADGVVNQHIEYFAFGESFVDEHLNSYNTPYKFNGKELDEETGWYYYGARYYDPRVSLWLGVDPLADKYPSLSPYIYCANNPILLVDPDGMDPVLFGILQRTGEAKFGVSRLGESKTVGQYNVVPVYSADNKTLIAYNAGRYMPDGEYRTEYQMQPGDLAGFTKNVSTYTAGANLVYCAGEPDWNLVMMTQYGMQGDYDKAFNYLGQSWANAVKDPGFWLSVVISLGVSALNSAELPKTTNASSNNLLGDIQQYSGKTQVTFTKGKASEFYKTLNPEWNGSMYKVDEAFSRTSFKTADGTRVSLTTTSKSTGMPSIKIETKDYKLILRFPEY